MSYTLDQCRTEQRDDHWHQHWLGLGQGIGMDHLLIHGKAPPLCGRIRIGGSKNASLPIIAATLLTSETVTLRYVPKLSDVSSMLHLLGHLHSYCQADEDTIMLTARNCPVRDAPYELVRKMRTSILVLGPLLARYGQARVSMPGGCAIGARPIDIHLEGFRAMGAQVTLGEGYVDLHCPQNQGGRLQGTRMALRMPSVGATQNLMMAATLAKGETIIQSAAQEPEVVELAECLQAMGANISGAGSDEIRIIGQSRLHGCDFSIKSDRIQAASYALMVAATGGTAELMGMDVASLGSVVSTFRHMGVQLEQSSQAVQVTAGKITATDIITSPFPGYPTDIQAQTMVLLTQADGRSTITERIFENRFMHVPELQRMGADIRLDGDCAIINATPKDQRFALTGAEVMATDLRASFCLIMLGLLAEGTTKLNRLYHLDRGYENLTENIQQLGANIERIHA